MTSNREDNIKIIAERIRRMKNNDKTINDDDLEMLLDLILGGEA